MHKRDSSDGQCCKPLCSAFLIPCIYCLQPAAPSAPAHSLVLGDGLIFIQDRAGDSLRGHIQFVKGLWGEEEGESSSLLTMPNDQLVILK